MKKVVPIILLSILSTILLSGCNPIKSVSSVVTSDSKVKTAEDYQSLKLDLDPSKDIPEYKRSLMPFAELPKTEKYLNTLLAQIIKSNKLENIFVNKQPQVKVSVDAAFNAVTLKHGLIVVNTGMLVQLDTQAELQAVLSHELIHLLNEDNEKDEMQKASNKVLQFGMNKLTQKYAGATENELLTKGLPDLLGQELLDDLVNAVAFTKWNREQELRADLSGVYLVHGAGINEKYMLKFLKKREDFEKNNSNLFESQNNEKSNLVSSVSTMFSGLGAKVDNQAPIDEKLETKGIEKNKDSITSKYYSAHTRYRSVTDVLVKDIGKVNLNAEKKHTKAMPLRISIPDYKQLVKLYDVRNVNKILNDKKLSTYKRYTQARDLVKRAKKGSLKDNSYLNFVLASIYDSRSSARKYAQRYRVMAEKNPNATLSIYSSLIGYYDKKMDKKKVLALLNKVNKEMDYPNSYLAQTIKYQKKYGISTDMAEAQCVKTLDIRVARGCQMALGRALKTKSTTLLKAVSTNESNSDSEGSTLAPSSSGLSSLGKLLSF